MSEQNIDKRVAQYVTVRDRIREIEKRHKAELKEWKEMKDMLGGVLLGFLNEHKLQNSATSAGTFYVSTKKTASVQDAPLFKSFVIENQFFDLLEIRANAKAVAAYVEKHRSLPAGCNLTTLEKVGVRRGDGKDDDE